MSVPKAGLRRRAKRYARREAETQLVESHGDHWGTGTERQNAGLISMATRWNTELLAEDADVDPRTLSFKDCMVLVTRRGALNPDMKIVAMHVANAIKMEGQNQKDVLGLPSPGNRHVHYEYHDHQRLTEEEYQRRAARLQSDNGKQIPSGNKSE